MSTSRTIHPATGNVVEVVAVEGATVTYRTSLPTGFEIVGSYTIEPGTNPAYLPDEPAPFPHANWTDS